MPRANRSRPSAPWFLLLTLIVLLAGGLVWGLTGALAASPSPAASSSSTGNLVLKLGWTEDIDNLNVFIGYSDTVYEIWALNYSYLFGSGESNQPTLDLATEFPTKANGGISPDGKTWTIHIRSGVKFQDGVPLTASDVAFTYNYIIKNQEANLLNYVQGIDKVTALDPTTVQFTCSHPMAIGYMETQSIPILPEHIWQKVPHNTVDTSYGNKPPIIGSGPFETVTFNKGSYLKMVRNPYYYGEKPAISTIYFEDYQNPDTMVSDLRSGKIDGAWNIPAAEFTLLKKVPSLKAVAYIYYSWSYLEFNCYDKPTSMGNPVLRDPAFRQAINYAINKQRLCHIAYSGYAQPAATILPPNVWTNPDYQWQPTASEAYTFDLAKASQALTAAGYPLKNGVRLNKQGKPIVLRLETASNDPACQSMVKQISGWLQQLGLKIKLSVVDEGTLEDAIYNYKGNNPAPNFDLIVWDWVGYFDPGQTMDCFMTSQIGNLDEPYWSNAEYDKLGLEQARATDPQQRKQLIWRMQQLMYEQSPWIPIAYYDNLEAWNTAKWTGWKQMFGGTGGAWALEANIASYLSLRPKVATTTGSSGASTASLITASVIVAAIVVAVVFFLVRRRRRERHVEDEA